MTEEELNLLKACYCMVPENRKGHTRCIQADPAGNTYEFTEYEWSIKIRKLIGLEYEPTGI